MQVVIKNEEGQYLSGTQGKTTFVDRKERAYVYDLTTDDVEGQIKAVKDLYGYVWTWEPLGDTDGLTRLPRSGVN